MPDLVLLIGAEWRPRALLRAQLLETGFDVIAVECWNEAEGLLRTRRLAPDAVILDVVNLSDAAQALDALIHLVSPRRVLVLTSVYGLSLQQIADRGYPHVMQRPLQIGGIVGALRRIVGEANHLPSP